MTAPASDKTPFSLAEWGAIAAILLVWGVNNAAAKLATEEMPPLLIGGLRFAIALIVLAPFLKPPFPPLKQIGPIILLCGPLHFGLIYWGFALIENLSPMVVALQLWIPMTAFFAWRMLGERMAPAALAGLLVAFVGVAWMSLDPHGAADLPGIALGLVASALWALGTVLVRKMPGVPPLKMQALTSLVAAPALLAASFAFEGDVVGKAMSASWFVWATVIWAGLASTVGATALLFWLVQRREPSRVTPWFLLTPLLSVGIVREPEAFARAEEQLPGIRWLHDVEGEIARLWDVTVPQWVVLDPALRVIFAAPLAAGEQVLERLAQLPDINAHAGVALVALSERRAAVRAAADRQSQT